MWSQWYLAIVGGVLVVVVALVVIMRPKRLKLQIGPGRAPLLSLELDSGPPDSREPASKALDRDD